VKLKAGDLVRLIPKFRYAVLFTAGDPRDGIGNNSMNPGDLGVITGFDPVEARHEILIVGEDGNTFTGYIHPNWVEIV